MPYCTPQEIHDRYPAVVDTTGLTPNEWGPSIAYATAIVDGFVGARYPLPLATDAASTPPLAKAITIDLAVCDMLDRFAHAPDWLPRIKERAIQLLQSLAAGELVLVGPGGTVVSQQVEDSDRIRSSTGDYVPTFGVSPSLSERIDPTRVADELAARGILVDPLDL